MRTERQQTMFKAPVTFHDDVVFRGSIVGIVLTQEGLELVVTEQSLVVLNVSPTRTVAVCPAKVESVEYRNATESRVRMESGRSYDVLGSVDQVRELLS